jgi:hypothetical protein
MEVKAQKQKLLKRTLLSMLLAVLMVAGSVAVPAFQSTSVHVTYASGCEGGNIPGPDPDCQEEPRPTPTATPDPDH